MKKFLTSILVGFTILIGFSFTNAALVQLEVNDSNDIITFNSSNEIFEVDTELDKEDTSKIMKRENIEPLSNSVVQRIINSFNIGIFNGGGLSTQGGSNYLKTVINYALSFLAFIALFIIIYGFFRMFFSKNGQESFDKAKKIIYTAAFALILIGISRILISGMFWLFFQIKGPGI